MVKAKKEKKRENINTSLLPIFSCTAAQTLTFASKPESLRNTAYGSVEIQSEYAVAPGAIQGMWLLRACHLSVSLRPDRSRWVEKDNIPVVF
jgi:hypothetical protein